MKRATKTKIKDKLVNITLEILEHFYNTGGNILSASISKQAARDIFYTNFYYQHTEVPFAQWLYRLRDQGYLAKATNSDSFEFTLKSKIKLVKTIGRQAPESTKYHFVSFDIPEKFKTQRDKFRYALRELGFKRIQDSLWVTNKDVYDFVQEISLEYQIEKFIVNVISSQSDIDGVIDKMFSK